MRDTNDNECLVRRIAMRDAGFNYSFPPGIASYCQVLPPGITKYSKIMSEATLDVNYSFLPGIAKYYHQE